jgi:hypothetical protein
LHSLQVQCSDAPSSKMFFKLLKTSDKPRLNLRRECKDLISPRTIIIIKLSVPDTIIMRSVPVWWRHTATQNRLVVIAFTYTHTFDLMKFHTCHAIARAAAVAYYLRPKLSKKGY